MYGFLEFIRGVLSQLVKVIGQKEGIYFFGIFVRIYNYYGFSFICL